ncbi:hypothetical protein HPB51_024887 [Rhipicephalus microplus]|uniref:Uncharacterized protein n=1 Tax=Rhipicephalus microplus TaxID=6941 RepID=A0A9J6EPK1_RHIMP|nr:hypothetical protein HPB51_024887 [Rhipicephalus microplus]
MAPTPRIMPRTALTYATTTTVATLDKRPTPPSVTSESPLPPSHMAMPQAASSRSMMSPLMVAPDGYSHGHSGYDELDPQPPRGGVEYAPDCYRSTPSPAPHPDRYGGGDVRWRDPDLHEVIEFLGHPNSVVRANAAAYLQHLCYMDNGMKQKTRALGGIPLLIELLNQDFPEIQRNACGALRNLSYGRQNDENKCISIDGVEGPTPKTRVHHDAAFKRKAIACAETDGNRAASRSFGVPETCVRDRRKQKQKIIDSKASRKGFSGPQQGRFPQIKELLGVYALEQRAAEWPVTTELLQRAIRNAGGIPALVRLLRKTPDNEIRELVTGVLWNLSSCEELKRPIIDDALQVLVNHVIIPLSGWDRNRDRGDHTKPQEIYWTIVFRNANGVLSSAGEYARRKLRECEGLCDALLHLMRTAVRKNDMDNKSVENCVCTLRNLSYRLQEVEDPEYDKHAPAPTPSRATGAAIKVGDSLGCFGAKKKKEALEKQKKESSGSALASASASTSPRPQSDPPSGMELLWQPEVVQPYLALLSECSNPETLEAAAGAIQNLAACYWQVGFWMRVVGGGGGGGGGGVESEPTVHYTQSSM